MRVLGDPDQPFALLYRPGACNELEVFLGDFREFGELAQLDAREKGRELLALIPYRQIVERGFECRDDGEPIMAMEVRERSALPVSRASALLPRTPIDLLDAGFDIDDDGYAAIVDRVVREEIGRGAGSNFVIKRTFTGRIRDYSVRHALSLFASLLSSAQGARWTFVVHTGRRTFVGATPEEHVGLAGGVASMNPISGTYRYTAAGPDLEGLLEFLADPKETEELYMVVDEELKMMARVCDEGGRVTGPQLKEMTRLAHTEYFIRGRSRLTPARILRETMFAPTVIGSPLVNACRVIARHEPSGRRYYSGVVALLGDGPDDTPLMDSAILIRTADIDAEGLLRLDVGATLVRASVPRSEVTETWTKAAGLLDAIGTGGGNAARPAEPPAPLAGDPRVQATLVARNATLSRFWLDSRGRVEPVLAGLRTLVVDAEDAFTAMLGRQLEALGPDVTIRPWDAPVDPAGYDLVVVGPGPGDPRDLHDPRIRALRTLCARLLEGDTPFLAECLGHQTLASLLGLELIEQAVPSQGLQEEVDFFGQRQRVGFYNTYSAVSDRDVLAPAGGRGTPVVCRDPRTGKVHAVRGRGFASVQFHIESLLTEHGEDILRDLLAWTLSRQPVR